MRPPTPPVSPDGAYWWDGSAWQPMPDPTPAPQAPQISPDGAYWWDGAAWRPIAQPARPSPPSSPVGMQPSWLPAGTELPGTFRSSQLESRYKAPELPTYAAAPPMWQAPAAPPSANRAIVAYAAIGAIVLMALGAGAWTLHQNQQGSNANAGNSQAGAGQLAGAQASATAPVAPSPSPVVLPPTADIAGDYCPISSYGSPACWKGSFTNTGPTIGKLAFIFIGAGPYTNWFSTHSNEIVSGFYTSPGCDVDRANTQIVCGSVDPGGQVSVYLIGDATTRGTFLYGVKFADISSGSPVYINANPDGTHMILSWQERIS